ncbi:MAG: RHS repeat-associated core domain-containing protein [Terriglobales bacterium]
MSTLFPDTDTSGNHGQIKFDYPLLTTTHRTQRQDASTWIDSYTYFDGLGRVVQARSVDPEGDDFVDTTYDSLGRVRTVSNPHRTASSSSDGISTTEYDALGRVRFVTRPDGSQIETQYSGNCATTYDETRRARKSCNDALGRLVRVDEPSPGAGSGSVANGSLAINGPLLTTTVGGQAATYATGSVAIQGAEQSQTVCPEFMAIPTGSKVGGAQAPTPYSLCDNPQYFYDQGWISITVNGHQNQIAYQHGSDPTNLAAYMANQISSVDPYVTATSSGGTVYLTARTAGAVGNYFYSTNSASTDTSGYFSSASFWGVIGNNAASGQLAGGQNAVGGTTVYDAGTITATVGGFTTAPVSYGQSSNSSAAQVAAALAAALNVSASPVTASAPSTTISLIYKTVGAGGNVSAAATPNPNQPQYFPSGSFGGSGALSGGSDPDPFLNSYTTVYAYDAFDNLQRVDQQGGSTDPGQWRTRLFTYDSLSQLITAANPETGTICYGVWNGTSCINGYDDDGNLVKKTDARGVTITYSYDGLHRLQGKTYSTGEAAVGYSYDLTTYNGLTITNGKGRRTGMSDASGLTAWSYDAMGRVVAEQRKLGTVSKKISYVYKLSGALGTLTYPSGTAITYTWNAAGRLLSAVDSGNKINYATLASYTPMGAIQSLKNGASVFRCEQYNGRLQPLNLGAFLLSACPADFSTPTAAQTVVNLNYDFHLSGGNNGDVWGIGNRKNTARSQSFDYDQLNRLALARTPNSTLWGDAYVYDGWGNLLQKNVTQGTAENLQVTAAANNRLSGYSYDAAGDLLNDGLGHTLVYNAENRIGSAAGVTYTYDGDGNRVNKSSGKLYWNASVGMIAESNLSGTFSKEYVYFNGQRIARKDISNKSVHYYFSDHLQSTSIVTNATGGIEQESDYYPWGMERVITDTTPSANVYKFTGKERDSESGLDEFGARYYGSSLGRFMTPDWAAKPVTVPYAHFGNPQSLNLYSYVQNNPTTVGDPDGHEVDLGDDRKKAQKLLLQNVSKQERKMFEAVKNNDTGKYELKLKAGAGDNFHGEHTVGFTRLSTAIGSDKTVTVNVSNKYTDAGGQSHDVSREYGGGVTINQRDGNSTVYVSPKGNPFELHGTEGQTIKDPLNIIMGHETLGHGLENMTGGDTSQHKAIEIENQLRQEQNKPERAQDPE